MRTHAQVQPLKAILTLFLQISIAVLLLSLSAKVTVPLPNTPVPITFQVLAVLLLGLTLGSREAAASVGAYLVAIASGLPLDARGLGTAAFAGSNSRLLDRFSACCSPSRHWAWTRHMERVCDLLRVCFGHLHWRRSGHARLCR